MLTQTTFLDVDLPRTDPQRITRSNDPETSREAAEAVVASGTVTEQQRCCLLFIKLHPGKTTAELGELHPTYDRYVFGRRVSDLVRAEMVRWLGKRDCTVGRPARPVEITLLGREVLEGRGQ